MDLSDKLRTLGLTGLAHELDDAVALATKKRFGPLQVLEHAVDLELGQRKHRSLERRLSRSKIGHFKPMTDFDWAWPKKIDRQKLESCLHLDFLEANRNVILVAPQGLGKTMIAKNIAHQAIAKGHTVVFLTAGQLLLDLGSRDSARALEARLRHYSKQSLLVIDELGYLSYDNHAADLLFQLVNRRYETKSIVVTTNLAFSQWPTIFPSATSATALIDRIIHHADIIGIEGDSYRRREAEEHRGSRATAKAGPKNSASS
jgi:DNA replication protein DnaC